MRCGDVKLTKIGRPARGRDMRAAPSLKTRWTPASALHSLTLFRAPIAARTRPAGTRSKMDSKHPNSYKPQKSSQPHSGVEAVRIRAVITCCRLCYRMLISAMSNGAVNGNQEASTRNLRRHHSRQYDLCSGIVLAPGSLEGGR
jgi:hypothetical protein